MHQSAREFSLSLNFNPFPKQASLRINILTPRESPQKIVYCKVLNQLVLFQKKSISLRQDIVVAVVC